MMRTKFIDAIGSAVDQLLATIPGEIVPGLPPGIGKPNPFVNALYQRIQALPSGDCASLPRFHWKIRSAKVMWSYRASTF